MQDGNEIRVKVLKAKTIDHNHQSKPGTLLSMDGQVAVGAHQTLQLVDVQRAGKARMSWDEFLRGTQLKAGDMLSSTGDMLSSKGDMLSSMDT